MEPNYYKRYYHLERKNWWFLVREGIIKEQLQKQTAHFKQPLKILNIGASTGRTSEFLQAFGEVYSIEYDYECCVFTREKTGLDIIHGSITELPFPDATFDVVCAYDVIEHVENERKATEEMLRVCKPNGVLHITVPAFDFLWGHHDEVNHHFRRYTKGSLLACFAKASTQLVYSTYFNTILFLPIALFRVLVNLLGLKREKTTSDFDVLPHPLASSALYHIFNIERYLLRYFKLPVGVSVMAIWRKH
jgi:SAM-dependent methyltransferase